MFIGVLDSFWFILKVVFIITVTLIIFFIHSKMFIYHMTVVLDCNAC